MLKIASVDINPNLTLCNSDVSSNSKCNLPIVGRDSVWRSLCPCAVDCKLLHHCRWHCMKHRATIDWTSKSIRWNNCQNTIVNHSWSWIIDWFMSHDHDNCHKTKYDFDFWFNLWISDIVCVYYIFGLCCRYVNTGILTFPMDCQRHVNFDQKPSQWRRHSISSSMPR